LHEKERAVKGETEREGEGEGAAAQSKPREKRKRGLGRREMRFLRKEGLFSLAYTSL
jgi:hypothetical protein